jgi:hypothetical protein
LVNLALVNLALVNLAWFYLGLGDLEWINLAWVGRVCDSLTYKLLTRRLMDRLRPNRRFVARPLLRIRFGARGSRRRFLGALKQYDSGLSCAPVIPVRCENIQLRRRHRLADRHLPGVRQCICGWGRRSTWLAARGLVVARDERKTRLRLLHWRSGGVAFARILGCGGASFLYDARRLGWPLRAEAAAVADTKRLRWKYSVHDIGGIRRG